MTLTQSVAKLFAREFMAGVPPKRTAAMLIELVTSARHAPISGAPEAAKPVR